MREPKILPYTQELLQHNIVRYFPLFKNCAIFVGVPNGVRAPGKIEHFGETYYLHYAEIEVPEGLTFETSEYRSVYLYEKIQTVHRKTG